MGPARLASMDKRRAAKRLRIAVIGPLVLAAFLPCRATALVCRVSGISMPADACCPDPDDGALASSRPDQVALATRLTEEGCCLLRTIHARSHIAVRSVGTTIPRPTSSPAMLAADQLAPLANCLPSSLYADVSFRPPPLVLKRSRLI